MKNEIVVELEAFSGKAIAVLAYDSNGFDTRHPIPPEPASEVMGKVRITSGQVEKFVPEPAVRGVRKKVKK